MTKILLSVGILFSGVLTSCSSGTVGIDLVPASNSGNPMDLVTSNGEPISSFQPASPVYFDSISFDYDRNVTIQGAGYLSPRANTTEPYIVDFPSGIQFKKSSDPSGLTVGISAIAPTRNELIYVKAGSNGFQMDDLFSYNTNTGAQQQILTIPSGVQAIASNSSAQYLAWLDAQGQVNLYSRETKNKETINISDASITQLSFRDSNPKGTELLATSKDRIFTYLLGQPLTPKITPFEQSDAVSAQGDVREVSANKDNTLVAFWVDLPDGTQKLRIADLSMSSTADVADLYIPAKYISGVVCPSWYANDLYFSNYVDSTYSIFRARRVGPKSTWEVTLFARPLANGYREGLICPKL